MEHHRKGQQDMNCSKCIICGYLIHIETDAVGEYWAHDEPDPDDEHLAAPE
jgi:hypothetical protein